MERCKTKMFIRAEVLLARDENVYISINISYRINKMAGIRTIDLAGIRGNPLGECCECKLFGWGSRMADEIQC